ncbi:MAG TPA: hypothetical protein VFS40_12825 [Gemmatimonadales bacterium]|nr:hypothetical protein [Gemmatimonadales bacterium]
MSAKVRREPPNGGSLPSAINWMGGLALLLFWLPVAGPFLAGLVGGRIAGTVTRAVVAVFLPAILTGVLVAAGVTYLADAFWGVLAGLGGVALSLLNVGPLFVGAVVGGLVAQATGRARWRRPGAG